MYLNKLFTTACLTLLLVLGGCVSEEKISIDRTVVEDPSSVIMPVSGSAKTTGMGKPKQELKRTLGQSARADMIENFPAGKQQKYANVAVNFKTTNFLLFSVTKAELSGQLIHTANEKVQTKAGVSDSPKTPPAQDKPKQATASPADRPGFIVNARLGFTPWDKLTPWNPAITHLRIPGGSVSQYTWLSWDDVPKFLKDDQKKREQQTIISDKMVAEYAQFAKDKNVATYYCLNINDKLENQLLALDKFYAAGVNITHIELGNETYLPKFRDGKKEGLGFTHKIGIQDYLTLAEAWLPSLERFDAELLIVMASRSMDGSGGDKYREAWNNAMLDFLKKNPGKVQGIVVHAYGGSKNKADNEEDAIANLSFSYMDSFPLPIHITESGTWDADWTASGINTYKNWHRNLYEYVNGRNDGSRYGCHVLYNPRARPNHPHMLYGPKGITPIGVAAMEFPYEE